MNLTNKATVAHTSFVAATEAQRAVKDAQAERMLSTESADERVEFDKARKLAETHELYNSKLAEMSVQALNYFVKNMSFVDADKLAAQSRECKKRAVKVIEALAHSTRVADRALDSVLQRLAAKKDATLNLMQIQREMQHDTTTQAQYFKTFAEIFAFASYSKSDKTLTFKYDSKVLSELMKLYSTATTEVSEEQVAE